MDESHARVLKEQLRGRKLRLTDDPSIQYATRTTRPTNWSALPARSGRLYRSPTRNRNPCSSSTNTPTRGNLARAVAPGLALKFVPILVRVDAAEDDVTLSKRFGDQGG